MDDSEKEPVTSYRSETERYEQIVSAMEEAEGSEFWALFEKLREMGFGERLKEGGCPRKKIVQVFGLGEEHQEDGPISFRTHPVSAALGMTNQPVTSHRSEIEVPRSCVNCEGEGSFEVRMPYGGTAPAFCPECGGTGKA